MSETYQLAPAPKFAGLRVWDCEICEHESLAKPVFLSGPRGLIAAGTGCAAKALGFSSPRRVRQEFDALQAAADRQAAAAEERSGRYGFVLLLAALTGDHPVEFAPVEIRQAFQARKLDGETFPAFIGRVAASGTL